MLIAHSIEMATRDDIVTLGPDAPDALGRCVLSAMRSQVARGKRDAMRMLRAYLTAVALIALLAAVGLTACTAQSQTPSTSTTGGQTIAVALTDTTVTASQTTFQPGVRYHFLVTNHGTRAHQFWLMPQGMAQRMGQMPMGQWRQQLLYSSQDIGPGMMATVDYTFTTPMAQQQLAFGCYTTDGQSLVELPMRVTP